MLSQIQHRFPDPKLQILLFEEPATSLFLTHALPLLQANYSIGAMGLKIKEQLEAKLEATPISGVYSYAINLSDPSILCFSSGTLDQHKGILRTYKSWATSFALVGRYISPKKKLKGIVLGSLPYSLSLFGAMESLQRGVHPLVFSSEKLRFFDVLEENTSYLLWLTPVHCSFYIQALKDQKIVSEKRITTIFVGGAFFSNAQRTELQQVFPDAKIYSFFGTSETSFISLKSPEDTTDSVGVICPEVAVECRDEKHTLVPPNEQGTLWVKSSQNFTKYLDNTIAHEERNGYISVHDSGYIDKTNRLYFRGRKGRTVSISGHIVYLDSLELWFKEELGKEQLALIARPHTKKEHELLLYISEDIAPSTWKELKKKAQNTFGNQGVPKTWIHRTKWPMLENGKTDYNALQSDA